MRLNDSGYNKMSWAEDAWMLKLVVDGFICSVDEYFICINSSIEKTVRPVDLQEAERGRPHEDGLLETSIGKMG